MSEDARPLNTGRRATKLTPKQRAFVQAYIVTGNASEAYRQAYDTSKMSDKAIGNEASRLLAHPGITLEVERLRAEHAGRHNVTIDSLTAELEKARQGAETANQYGAAVSAILGKAKLHGLIVDKAKVEVSTHEDALRALQQLVEPQERTNGASVH
jgi:phage terminase small subunit